jgi:hypothetical protein
MEIDRLLRTDEKPNASARRKRFADEYVERFSHHHTRDGFYCFEEKDYNHDIDRSRFYKIYDKNDEAKSGGNRIYNKIRKKMSGAINIHSKNVSKCEVESVVDDSVIMSELNCATVLVFQDWKMDEKKAEDAVKDVVNIATKHRFDRLYRSDKKAFAPYETTIIAVCKD